MLDPRAAFKAGFLYRCAEAGLTPAETDALVEKAAGLKDLASGAITGGLGGLKLIRELGMGGLGLSALGGAGVGYMASELRRGTVDPDDVKKQELIAAYNTFGDQLRQQKKLKEPGANSVRMRI